LIIFHLQPESPVLIFILSLTDSLHIISYEISGKKHQLDFELNAILHFKFAATCAVINLGNNGNCQFFGKTVNTWLQNGRLLVNDPFVGKLHHFAINHASGLRLNKKANYVFSQPSQNL
jgi:hypothetical protein